MRDVGAQVVAMLTMRDPTRTVADTLDAALDKGELVALEDGVDRLERQVGHLHCALSVILLVPELVAQGRVESQVPVDTGQSHRVSLACRQQYVAINGSNRWRTVTLPRL